MRTKIITMKPGSMFPTNVIRFVQVSPDGVDVEVPDDSPVELPPDLIIFVRDGEPRKAATMEAPWVWCEDEGRLAYIDENEEDAVIDVQHYRQIIANFSRDEVSNDRA